MAACTAPPPLPPPAPPAPEVFSPPSPARPAVVSPSPAPIGPIATRVAILIPGASPSPSPSARPVSSPGPSTKPAGSPSPGARLPGAASPSPGALPAPSPPASPTPGPLAGALVYARAGSIVVQGAAGGEPRTLVQGTDLSSPRWSPNGQSVLFTGGVGQAAELYVVPAAGGSPRRLTNNARPEHGATWSPRGDRVAFSLPRSLGPGGASVPAEPEEVWVVGVGAGSERKLTDGFDPAWAPDGSRLAYATNGRRTDDGATENAIHVVQADGSGDRPILAVSAIPQDLQAAYNVPFRPATVRLRAPAWAPDGRRLAASADGHTGLVATFDEQGQDLRLWALAYEGGVGQPHWSPRGDLLAVETQPATGVPVVVIVDLYRTAERRIGGLQAGFAARAPTWAPDGGRLAVVARPPAEQPGSDRDPSELRLYTADGSLVRTVTSGDVEAPAWSGAAP